MWTVPLTEFQQEYLRNCSHRWNVKTGATRSGKTYLDCAVTIPKRICAARGEGLLVLMGNTLGTLERNVLSLMRELWGRPCRCDPHLGSRQRGTAVRQEGLCPRR